MDFTLHGNSLVVLVGVDEAVDGLLLRFVGVSGLRRLVDDRLLGDRLVSDDGLRLMGHRLVAKADGNGLSMYSGWLGRSYAGDKHQGRCGVQNLNQKLDQILKFNLVSNRGFGCGCSGGL